MAMTNDNDNDNDDYIYPVSHPSLIVEHEIIDMCVMMAQHGMI